MSYCRWGEENSDVYVIHTFDGVIECVGCEFTPANFFRSRSQAIAHLKIHRELGDIVPEFVFNRLEYEIRELGDQVAETNLPVDKLMLYCFFREIDCDDENDEE